MLFLLFAFPIALALQPQGTYDVGPIELDDYGKLWHRVDISSRTAFLAIHVNDTSIANATAPWLGLGISEPTSGSMLGADVATGEFTAGEDCVLVDRHVPFVAFPLIEEAPDSPSAFPVRDDCQDDGSWVMRRCSRDLETAEMILEVERSLDAHDSQDREIVTGVNSFIYAYGSSFGYHGSRRAAMKVAFYEEDGGELEIEQPLPDDVDGNMLITATDYNVPSNVSTLYACTSKKFELEADVDRMIVAIEPVLNYSDVDMVHHLTVFLCTEEEYANKIAETQPCYFGFDNGIAGPLGNPAAGCSTFVFAYAKGIGRFVLPKEAGFLVKPERSYVVMETHYDNPQRVKDNIDTSGVRLHYTDTRREHEAASLLIGDSLVSRFDETVKNDFKYLHTCPKECTSKFSSNINIVGSFLHMHTTGKEIYTNKFSFDEEFVETVNKVNFWSDSFQNYLPITPAKVLKPGEQLSTTCLYDTTKRPETKFGLETIDEMCMDFLAYWPRQVDPETGHEINICSLYIDDEGNATACGDSSNITREVGYLPVKNPSFVDNEGAPTSFGDELDTCPSLAPTPGGSEESISTPQPDESDSPLEGDDDENVCFPASATVELKDGSRKRMGELTTGDEVQVGRDLFSPIFMFTHKKSSGFFSFLRIRTATGHAISLTRTHFIYINGGLVAAINAKVGDNLELANGKQTRIVSIERHVDKGLFNPQTFHGDIVVNGILASTYTKTVQPTGAHGLLAPLRALYKVFQVDTSHFFDL